MNNEEGHNSTKTEEKNTAANAMAMAMRMTESAQYHIVSQIFLDIP